MSTDFKRISRTAISALGATSLLVTSLAITAPTAAQAQDVSQPATLADANAQIDGTITSLNQQIAGIDGRLAPLDAEIAELDAEDVELGKQQERDTEIVNTTVREIYMAEDMGELEVAVGSNSFSEVVGRQTMRDSVANRVNDVVEKREETRKKKRKNREDRENKRKGLVALKDSSVQKRDTKVAQEQAKTALAAQTLNDENLYQERKRQLAAQAVTAAVTPRNTGSGFSSGGGSAAGLTGSIGYARPGGNCVNEPGINNPRNGNPINWPVTSSTPRIGATALWTYNHTGVVTGIWSNGDVEVRHQNYTGGQTRFPRGAFRGFR